MTGLKLETVSHKLQRQPFEQPPHSFLRSPVSI
jgi:hypothetical protein